MRPLCIYTCHYDVITHPTYCQRKNNSTLCKHRFPCNTLTHSTNADKNFCFYAEVNFWDFVSNDNSNKGTTARLNETRFGPNISPINKLAKWLLLHTGSGFQWYRMTFITHGFRVSVVYDVRERVRDFMITFALYVKKIFINWVC
jgi:hypothetical protein